MIEKLTAILSDFFEVGGNCYHYILERVKYAKLTPDDFREYDDDDMAEIAEYLIANGVTVQKWIPVSERLPKRGEFVLFAYEKGNRNPTMYAKNTMAVGRYDHKMFLVEGCAVKVTHWMPLPEPPK